MASNRFRVKKTGGYVRAQIPGKGPVTMPGTLFLQVAAWVAACQGRLGDLVRMVEAIEDAHGPLGNFEDALVEAASPQGQDALAQAYLEQGIVYDPDLGPPPPPEEDEEVVSPVAPPVSPGPAPPVSPAAGGEQVLGRIATVKRAASEVLASRPDLQPIASPKKAKKVVGGLVKKDEDAGQYAVRQDGKRVLVGGTVKSPGRMT